MDALRTLLEQQPMIALFLTIGIGYLVGEINIKGFTLGVGAVLFVALAVGWFAPKAAPAPMVGTLGLALFLYAVGLQYGKQFFVGLTSPAGVRANLIALTGVLVAGIVALLLSRASGLTIGHGLGLFAGAGTSTPTLQAALVNLGNDDPAVGYSVAYPIGVAGPILFLYIAFMVLKPRFDVKGTGMEVLEVVVQNAALVGKTFADLAMKLPDDVRIVARRRAHHNEPAAPDQVVTWGDVLLFVGPSRERLVEASKTFGEVEAGRIAKDRSDLDYIRLFASKANIVGRALGELAIPGANPSVVVHVRRGDADLLSQPGLVLEYGDRVGLLAHRDDFSALRRFFGDSIKSTAEFSYISIGVGMALGFLLGAISFPLPGIGKLALGLSGVLIVALILGKMRRTGNMHWMMPLSANLVLRNLGLTLFLAQVGMSSGPKFAATVSQNGLLMLGLASVVLVALVLPIMILGLLAFRMPFDEVSGIVAGACGNPAILSYSNRLSPTENPDLGYAMIFPGMTIVKILFVDIVPALAM
ncbi:aspartate:alanine exchanger family transporter [Cupriavidus respiraculi]|uniref:Aspartate/alanine antiporter n=1 Tax=Cupriavidus respiraculi TaxID=195930 RepID=A0ABM8WHI9_9BURK|nr:TrkA C-terminal domain-containing protein [Cupriavidus respiraculi]CAG9166869.1 Aspartate/alanine antiporter [Cupriavidus respiraculi]